MKGKFLRLVNNERKLAQILPSKASCTGGAIDSCAYYDGEIDCNGFIVRDICYNKDYTFCYGIFYSDVCDNVDRI